MHLSAEGGRIPTGVPITVDAGMLLHAVENTSSCPKTGEHAALPAMVLLLVGLVPVILPVCKPVRWALLADTQIVALAEVLQRRDQAELIHRFDRIEFE